MFDKASGKLPTAGVNRAATSVPHKIPQAQMTQLTFNVLPPGPPCQVDKIDVARIVDSPTDEYLYRAGKICMSCKENALKSSMVQGHNIGGVRQNKKGNTDGQVDRSAPRFVNNQDANNGNLVQSGSSGNSSCVKSFAVSNSNKGSNNSAIPSDGVSRVNVVEAEQSGIHNIWT